MVDFIKKDWASVLSITAIFVSAIVAAIILPEKVAVHFGIDGTPDRWGSKWEIILILPITSLFTYLMLYLVPKIDPKKGITSPHQKPMPQIRSLTMILILGIQLIIIHSAITEQINSNLLIGMIVTFAFIGIGNLMNSVKPNYFIGFRTPWTLESEEVWKKTHRLVSKLWVGGGLIYLCLLPFFSPPVLLFVLMLFILVAVIWPIVYSYKQFALEKKNTPLKN